MKRRERGASLVEYALLVALLSFASVAAVRVVGAKTTATFQRVGESMCVNGAEEGCSSGPSEAAD